MSSISTSFCSHTFINSIHCEIIKSVLIAINLAFAQNLIDFFSRGANLLVIFYLTKTFDKSLF